jgi:hypothetical protein
MRIKRVVGVTALIAIVASIATASRTLRRGVTQHAADDRDAPGSVDQWPPIPRRPGA